MITLNQSIIHIITEDFYVDISDDVEWWFDTSNYDDNNDWVV